MNDGKLTLFEITETRNNSKERVFHILKDLLGLRKLCAQLVPHFLNSHGCTTMIPKFWRGSRKKMMVWIFRDDVSELNWMQLNTTETIFRKNALRVKENSLNTKVFFFNLPLFFIPPTANFLSYLVVLFTNEKFFI